MANDTMVPVDARSSTKAGGGKSTRLHYLDWLQVIAVLGVFIFHALFPFSDLAEWNIKSTERSILGVFVYPLKMDHFKFFTRVGRVKKTCF